MAPPSAADNLMLLIGRALMALLFIPSGISKITGFEGTVRYIVSAHLPVPEVAAVVAILVEVGLAALLLVGYRTRWAALAIAVYVVVLAFAFHAYWAVAPAQKMGQMFNFYKNLAIVGGLLAIAVAGAGAWSIEGRRDHP